ncbi:hypothetical protein [Rhodalgimonas zhirmunskyi]|uniref:Uncharacterized protein n=1 Tax=Rhodalgimonas zhirmunskyi TaxID=2964767 RepID=A0AAJ1U6U1_9RHOB|nr:hypothetical protein [Rhodoalgimonas zhirmunskyi]MDQ2094100.1 hypothetical protein [Rhodoalgimonas zhirmunskyi]
MPPSDQPEDRRDDVTMDRDHAGLRDTFASRRYFKKFEAITRHLTRVAAQMQAERRLSEEDVKILTRYIVALDYTFRALSMKYLMVGRDTGRFFGSLEMDRVESGFPVFNELLVMANDAAQAGKHLEQMPGVEALKDEMVRKIVGDREIPTKLQFALSQRLYYEELLKGDLFWARNDPQAIWQGNVTDRRRRYMLHWAVYDSQINLPTIYLMEVEDSGRTALPKDERRWPEAQAHLVGQSVGGLKLVTIAKGFDEDFDDLHPKRLRRFHVGPMYSKAYTLQNGPLREVLEEAHAPEGQDWALAWTYEELESERVTEERAGWFSTVEREVFALDPFSGRGVDTGATRMERAIILPQRPFQVLAEKNPPGFGSVRKFVVGAGGRVLSY